MIPGTQSRPHRVHLATSGTRTALEAAEAKLLAAFPDGDVTVQIPLGTYTWSGQWNIDDIVNVQGKSKTGCILDKTDGTGQFSSMIKVDATSFGHKWRCRGFTCQGEGGSERDIAIFPQGTVDALIHNMDLVDFGRTAIQFRGDAGSFRGIPRGVIWDCTFTDMVYGLDSNGVPGYGVEVVGDGFNTEPIAVTPGSLTNMVYIEDNIFTRCRHSVAANNDSRYVARYNDVFETRINANPWDQHGLASWNTGGRWIECMHNTLHSNDGSNSFAGIGIRGGGGVLFDNDFNSIISSPSTRVVLVWVELYSSLSAGDQIYPTPYQTGDLEDLYAWDNRYFGSPQRLEKRPESSNGADNLIEGRDFFNITKPGYTEGTYPHPNRMGL